MINNKKLIELDSNQNEKLVNKELIEDKIKDLNKKENLKNENSLI